MDLNANAFDSTTASSVSLACCQSLCDLLRELPLPKHFQSSIVSESQKRLIELNDSNRSQQLTQNLTLVTNTAFGSHLENSLYLAKQQLNDLMFDSNAIAMTTTTTTTTVEDNSGGGQTSQSSSLSPLLLHLSLKGLFIHQNNDNNDNNIAMNSFQNVIHSNCHSLETIEPSIETHLEFNENLKLINDLQNDDNDCDDSNSYETSAREHVVSTSLGERVKARQRMAATTATTPHSVMTSSDDNSVTNANHITSNVVSNEKPFESEVTFVRKKEKSVKKEKTRDREKSCDLMNSNKDIVLCFDSILNQIMSSNENDCDADDSDDARDLSFDLRIDSKTLINLMNLSSKLKHSNRMKELEANRNSKLCSFLSLLTNQMIVWFSKFKDQQNRLSTTGTSDAMNDSYADDHDCDAFWQLLINASKLALNIMTSREMSQRIVLFEEMLEIIIQFLSNNLNAKTHVTSSRESSSPSKKSSKHQTTSQVLKTTTASRKHVTHWTEILELLMEFLSQNKSLNDSIILLLTRISMNSLFLNSNELQLISIQLLNHIFREYPKHRNSILEELLQSFHRIPLLKRTQSSQSSQNINVFTKLLMSLTQSLFICNEKTKISRELVSKQLTECLQIISSFLSSFVKKCLSTTTSATHNEYDLKSIFDHFLNDLLENGIYFCSTISANLLIQILTKLLISNLNPNQKSISLQIRLNSIEFLSQICSKFAKLLSKSKQLEVECKQTLSQLDIEFSREKQLLERILRLLNQFFNREKLFSEKLILSSLWIKEKPVLEIENKFFSILNAKTTNDADDDTIDSTTATLFIQYLELQEFSTIGRLFDASLSHVTSSLSLTTNTTQRSRAMKSLSTILMNCSLEKSTQLLSRTDLQIAMRSALLDASTSVREATIDLIGRFVLQSHSRDLCDKYCDLICERILDTGVSVRKRVIRILKDICIEFPEYEKCGEISVKIIKRVNDEGDGIRKLVLETARELWFSATATHNDAGQLKYKVMSLLHVISVTILEQLKENSINDSLQQLFEQIMKSEETQTCAQSVIDFIVAEVLCENEDKTTATSATTTTTTMTNDKKLLSLSAIHCLSMLANICPALLVKHLDSLQSLLSLNCDLLIDIHLRVKVIQTLEKVLPRAQNPSPQLLVRVEEDLTKNVIQSSALILSHSIKCLSVLISFHTKNYKLIHDLFSKFKAILLIEMSGVGLCPPYDGAQNNKPKLLRAIYSLGLFLKHFSDCFDFESKKVIFDKLLQLLDEKLNSTNATPMNDMTEATKELIIKSITSLGFIIESDPKLCLNSKVIQLYEKLLTNENTNDKNKSTNKSEELFCIQVLNNFRQYLSESIESDEKLNKSIEWSRESLKQMSSTSEEFDSGSTQSQIIQTYLNRILDKSLSASAQIRRVACNVIHVIQSGGHVHPLQLVPHLVAMTADDDAAIRSRADHVLHEIERKFHGFVAMKARAGVDLALRLCQLNGFNGFRLSDDNSDVTSRLSTLYHVICHTRQSRRGFITQLLRHFDITLNLSSNLEKTMDSSFETSIEGNDEGVHDDNADEEDDCDAIQLIFEMILFFPFNVCDEILYILQQLECIQSVNSTHTSSLFVELFEFENEQQLEEKFDENSPEIQNAFHETFAQQWEASRGRNRALLSQLLRALKRVFLVSFLRKLLKEFYLIKDDKITEYSPNETKLWEKPIHRRQIETSYLKEVLVKGKPLLGINCMKLSANDVIEEFKRFKSVSLTGNDSQISQSLIQQKLLNLRKTSASESASQSSKTNELNAKANANNNTTSSRGMSATTMSDSMSAHVLSNSTLDNELNDRERKRLLDSIRKTSCHVTLIDISTSLVTNAPSRGGANEHQKEAPPHSRTDSSNKRTKERKNSLNKKKKRLKRFVIESDSEEEPEEEDGDEEYGDSRDSDSQFV